MIAVFLFLFCARFVSSQKSQLPNIQWATLNQAVNVNDTVKLQCSVDSIGSRLVWTKERNNVSHSIAFENMFVLPQDEKNPKYVVSKDGGTYTLIINNVAEEDVGDYRCSITVTPSDTRSKVIRVTVRSPPSILENTSTSPITARVNSSAKLECIVSGTPPLQVTWTKEDNGLLPSGEPTYEGGTLRIDSVRKEYAGTYFCTARNDVKEVKKTYKLQVEFEPEIQVAKKRVGQALNNKNVLECKIAAFPEPEITWLKDGRVLAIREPNIQITKSALPNAITISKLEILPVNRTQYGTYSCRARNSMGNAEETIEFYETADVQCSTTCGSSFDYPDNILVFLTTCFLVLNMFRS